VILLLKIISILNLHNTLTPAKNGPEKVRIFNRSRELAPFLSIKRKAGHERVAVKR
jgi:hypothetical protein